MENAISRIPCPTQCLTGLLTLTTYRFTISPINKQSLKVLVYITTVIVANAFAYWTRADQTQILISE